MILCVGPNDKIQLISGSAVALDCHVSAMDFDGNVATPYRKNTAITTAATTDLSAAPTSGIVRNIKTINVRNKDVVSGVVTIQHTDGSTVVQLYQVALSPGQSLQYVEGEGWSLPSQINMGITLNRMINPFNVTNPATTGFNTMYSYTIPGNTLGTVAIPKRVHLVAWGRMNNNSGAGRNITFQINYGGVARWQQIGGNLPNTSGDQPWRVDVDLALSTDTGHVTLSGLNANESSSGSPGAGIGQFGGYFAPIGVAGFPLVVDTTVDQVLSLAVATSAVASTQVYTLEYAEVQVL